MRIIVPGTPVPKARARTVTQGGRTHSYTPERTKEWEETVQWIAARHRPPSPLRGPLAVAMTFYLPRPKRSKRDIPRGDVDNYAKAVMDACNGILWDDDEQIVRLETSKEYGEPRVEMEVREVG